MVRRWQKPKSNIRIKPLIPSMYVFTVADQQAIADLVADLGGQGEISVLIWTTTPWTLPANQAVSVNAELEYSVIQLQDDRVIVASALVESVMSRAGVEEYQVVGSVSGDALENLSLQHPFYDRKVPVLLGDHVTTDAGTGCVHTAPDHGVDDFNVGAKYGIGTLNYVDDQGIYRDSVELFCRRPRL